MKAKAYLQGCSAVHASGLYSMNGRTVWDGNQDGPRSLQRSQVFEQPLPEFGKLQLADKLAFGAASLAFSGMKFEDRSAFGISLANTFGSLSTDIRYMESVASGFPRPAFFSATLPSSPVAEVAIRLKMKGPTRVIAGGCCPGLNALDGALNILHFKKAPGMLVLAVNAIDRADTDSAIIASKNIAEPYCYGLFITDCPVKGEKNHCLTLVGDFDENCVAPEPDESYFLDMITAALKNENFHTAVSVPGFKGQLSIEKDS